MAYDFDGQCRRIDLYLRAEFPYLKTSIYRVLQHEYQIYIGNIDNFDYISDYFHNQIRFMGIHIYLVKEKPFKFNEIINPIMDNEISKNFEGLPFTNPNLCTHIESKYPDVDLCNLKENHNLMIGVGYGHKSSFQNNALINFYSITPTNLPYLIFEYF